MPQVPNAEALVVASHNPGKMTEIGRLLADLPVRLLSLRDLPDAPQLTEPHHTFEENAIEKAATTARASGHLALADDSGLVVPALGGAPGVTSSRVARSDSERIKWLLDKMREMQGDQRKAYFVCVVALAAPTGEILGTWTGRVDGLIAQQPRGAGGFGYDPMFWYPPVDQTFAQMSAQCKNAVSHRGEALRAFASDLPDILSRYKLDSN